MDGSSGGVSAGARPFAIIASADAGWRQRATAALAPHFHLAAAADEDALLAAALPAAPDLVLLGMDLCRGAGDLVRDLRGHPALGATPILLLAGGAADVAAADLAAGRAQDFVAATAAPAELALRARALVGAPRADAALRERASWLRMALDVAEVGTWRHDLRRDVLLCDARSREHFCTGDRDILLSDFIARVHPADVERIRAAIAAAHDPATSDGNYAEEYRIVRPDGSARWLSVRALVVFTGSGADRRIVEVIGVTRDVTERRRAEEENRALAATLEQRVAERTAELSAANRELESFGYAVSHDLRAPLRAMNGFSRALLEDYGAALPAEARRFLDEIAAGAERMGALIDALLALSRSTRGEMRRDPVDLSALAREILAELARAEPGRPVRTEVEPGIVARGDARMLEVVLQNLLGNAWKYTGRTQDAAIRLAAERAGDVLTVAVTDNGAGFDMRHAAKLFQPFQRLHRDDEFEGIGIGLATVQRIVARHGGSVAAEGRPGAGATIRFTLRDGAAATDSHRRTP